MVSVAVFVMAPFLIYEKARPTAGAGRTTVREGGPGRGGHGPSCCRSCPWIGGGGGRGGGLSPDIANAVLAPSLLGLPGAGRRAASFGSSLKWPKSTRYDLSNLSQRGRKRECVSALEPTP